MCIYIYVAAWAWVGGGWEACDCRSKQVAFALPKDCLCLACVVLCQVNGSHHGLVAQSQ